MRYSITGSTVYALVNGQLAVVDPATAAVTVVPQMVGSDLLVSPDGSTLYISNPGHAAVSVVSTATDTLTATIVPKGSPGEMVFQQ